jgi:hypothetical protein
MGAVSRPPSHGRGHWFDPSTAHHSEQALQAKSISLAAAYLEQCRTGAWPYANPVSHDGLPDILSGMSVLLPRERQALAYITTLKQLGVCAIVSTMHARSTAP